MAVIEDIKESKAYVLGVLGFATVVASFLIEALHFPPEATLLSAAGIAILVLYLGFLIIRSENRQAKALREHEDMSQKQVETLTSALSNLQVMLEENRLDNLRIQLNQYIQYQPQNHDTILKVAERYFVEYKGDWVMTDEFERWVENENKAGRKVHIPHGLSQVVATRVLEEKTP